MHRLLAISLTLDPDKNALAEPKWPSKIERRMLKAPVTNDGLDNP